jgi:hypothetical protein
MPCYIISYDVRVGGDYEPLYAAIKSYGTWAHITQSTWAIVTDTSPTAVRDRLAGLLSPQDRLFVIKSGTGAAWRNVMSNSEWLKKYL